MESFKPFPIQNVCQVFFAQTLNFKLTWNRPEVQHPGEVGGERHRSVYGHHKGDGRPES